MKKIIASVVMIAMTATFLVGCNASNKVEKIPPYPVSVNNVTIEKAPKAVASLSPALTKLLIDLGYRTKIVGFSDGDTLPPLKAVEPVSSEPEKFRWFWEEKPKPIVPDPVLESGEIGTALIPNLENIGKYLPEIVFTTTPITKAQMDKLDAVNIRVVVIPSATSIEGVKANHISIIKAMSGLDEAELLGGMITQEIQRQVDYIASVKPDKASFLYISTEDMLIATGDSYESSLISTVANNLAQEQKNYTVTKEELAGFDPDIILYAENIDKAKIVSSELFKDKKAVVADRLIAVPNALIQDQSKDVALSISSIAKLIYPDVNFDEPVPDGSSETKK